MCDDGLIVTWCAKGWDTAGGGRTCVCAWSGLPTEWREARPAARATQLVGRDLRPLGSERSD
eukprot:6189575-Pleurochrysis_carterae.AAC.1